ncbi:MAG: Cu(I)-responsive transcriptional regulator [Alphaproteobacteria bacterium]|nr:Cu(I)-responsive transcriptional regulator [Alphaproteobacteria bacterium]
MNISAASNAAGLPAKTVRYYADIGLVPAPVRSEAGYRSYDDASVRKLVFVRRAREFGFSISECRELLGLYEDRRRSSADVKRIATARLEEIAKKQRELQSLHDELAHLVDACRGDDRPDCPIIDSLGNPRSEPRMAP